MPQVHNVTINLAEGALASMALSVDQFASLAAEFPRGLVELVDCELARAIDSGPVTGPELFDLVIGKPVTLPAPGADKVHGVHFIPSDGYLVLFSALAGNRQKRFIFSHGWPVLSVEDRNPTVTEAGRANNPAGGGQAA